MSEPDPTSPQVPEPPDETGDPMPNRGAASADDGTRTALPALPDDAGFSDDAASDDVPPDDRTVISREGPLARQIGHHGLPPLELGQMLQGQRLGHYHLEQFVGGGGMGAVFRAHDTMLDRTVAVKVLSSGHTSGEETHRRFRNEAQSAARLDHENIARVYYVGEDRGIHYIVFEYIEGINVRDLVGRDGPIGLTDAIDYTMQVAEALAHAALRDVVHRDIKPSNILITPDNRAKLVDMGLARLYQVGRSDEDITASGVTLGTFDYISPEQARDPRNADVRSDLYSLGCTLYFMLSGQPPFPDGTMLQKLLQHQGDSVPDVRGLRPDLPEEISPILCKLLAKSASSRYQKPEELIADLLIMSRQLGLESVSNRGTILVTSGPPVDSALRRTLPWLVPVVLLLLTVIGLHVSRGRTEPSPELPAFPTADSSEIEPTDTTTESGSQDNSTLAGTNSSREDLSLSVSRAPVPKPAVPDTSVLVNSGTNPEGNGNRTNGGGPSDLKDDVNDTSIPSKPNRDDFADRQTSAIDRAHRLALPFSSRPYQEDAERTIAPHEIASGEDVALDPVEALVVGTGDAEDVYPSIRAAVASAKNGDILELQFARRVVDRSIGIGNKRLTIRAGDGWSPKIIFRPETEQSGEAQADDNLLAADLFTVNGGQLRLVNLDLEMEVPELPSLGTPYRSLVRARSGGGVQLENCRLTIRNTGPSGGAPGDGVRRLATSFVRLVRAQAEEAQSQEAQSQKTESQKTESRLFGERAMNKLTEIRLENCIARGDATFVSSESGQPFRLLWKNGLLVTSQHMLVVQGGPTHVAPTEVWETFDRPSAPAENSIEVDLRQLTIVAGSGVLTVSDSTTGESWMPITLRCHDCIVKIDTDAAMIEHLGREPRGLPQTFVYHGDRNYYEGVTTFWRFGSSPIAPVRMDFDMWLQYWKSRESQGMGSEINPHRDDVLWRQLPDKRLPLDSHRAADYVLDRINAPENPALRGASDGRKVGFRLDRMREIEEDRMTNDK